MKTLKEIVNSVLTESVSKFAPVLNKIHSPKNYAPEHVDALRDYSESSRDTNDMLWEHHRQTGKQFTPEPDTGDGPDQITHLDNAINSKRTPKPMTVYSGTRIDPRNIMKHGIVHHPAYLSTSLHHTIAKQFAATHAAEEGSDGEDEHHHILKINIPKGHPHAYLENGITSQVDPNRQEHEVLLPRGLNLKHVKTTTKASLTNNEDEDGNRLTKYVHTHEMQLPEFNDPHKDPNQLRLPFKEKHMKEILETFKSPTSLHGKLVNHYHKLNGKNTESEAVKDYTDDSSIYNQYHWDKHNGNSPDTRYVTTKELENHTEHMDNALNLHKTPHSLTVYSGINGDPRNRANEEGIVHHPAYLSTSLKSKTAVGFARSNATKNGMHILKINVPEGHPGAYVAGISHAPAEREFILPRGTNLKLTGHKALKRPSRLFPGEEEVHHYHSAEIVPKDSK